jgi:uncharacterized membrane protein YgcG
VRLAAILVAALLIAAAPAAAQDSADLAAEALRDDPVYVDPNAENALSPSEADALRDRLPADLYVAVLPASAGNAESIATALQSRLGGSVAVVAGDSFRVDGTARAEAAADEAFAAGDDVAPVLLDFVERASRDEPAEDDGGGAGGLILLGVAGAGGAALLVRRRKRRRAEAVEFAEVKTNARDDLVALGDDIRALDIDVEMPGVSPDVRADYETAVNAYDRADSKWRLARRPRDLEPVGSALEEGRWAMSSAKARLDGREPPERSSPCFFDPRHGPSVRYVDWAPPHGESRRVPACETDARRVEEGEEPEAREVTVGGERMPYWAAGPMYAPFIGGFFGASLLPGLMVGTMLGDTFDAGGGGGGDFGDGGGGFGGGDFGGGFGGGDFGGGG